MFHFSPCSYVSYSFHNCLLHFQLFIYLFIYLFFFLFTCFFIYLYFYFCRALEDESLKGLYRILSRSSQALSLIDLLRSANEEKKLKITWNKFGKLSFRSLVVSQVVHDDVKRMLLDLVGNACRANESNIADSITNRLTTDCYQVNYYFVFHTHLI